MFTQPGKRPGEGVDELIAYAREQLRLGDDRPWSLISSRAKLDKTLFEIEENGPGGRRRLIGKVAGSEKAKAAYDILRRLWDAGLCPPSEYCVPEPVAYFPERLLLLQERAAGTQLYEKIKSQSTSVRDAERAAEWLLALQELRVHGIQPGSPGNFQRTRDELMLALPGFTRRLKPLVKFIDDHLEADTPGVSSHGDYHPMNLYIDAQRVTAIDVDTFACREPMYDVGYFVAQTAIMGYQTFQRFDSTEEFRQAFLDTIATRAPSRFRKQRIRVHIAFAILRSLHFDFCILRTKPHQVVEPFLAAAERALSQANIRLAA